MKIEIISSEGKKIGELNSLHELRLHRHKFSGLNTNLRPIVEAVKVELIKMQKERMRNILDQYGYIDLADVQFYVSQNDSEAQAILSWYQAYDDLIWKWIDNALPSLKTLDEIMQIDIKSVEEEIFNQSIQKNPLP